LALTAGLLLGAAMRPELAVGDGPAGPQMLAGASGARASERPDEGLAYASYAAGVPDYVIGTDWRRPMAAAPPEPVSTPANFDERDDAPPATSADVGELTPVVYAAAEAERVSYPSLDGGATDEDASRAEPRTPPAPAPVDGALPEATGDTTVAR
jgi:hypothetical protein